LVPFLTIDRRIVMITAAFFGSVTLFCSGPSALLHFPDSLWLLILGQVLLGFACAGAIVPCLPEMTSAVLGKFGREQRE
jgi:MFS family permease